MIRLVVSVSIILLCLSALAVAQEQEDLDTRYQNKFPLLFPTEYNITGGGTRAQGMGSAFLAVSNDVSAATWNPAGLFGQEILTVGLQWLNYSGNGDFGATGLPGTNPTNAFSADNSFSNLGMFSLTAPIRIKGHPFVLGGSYSRTDDEYLFWRVGTDFQVDPIPFDDDTTTFPVHRNQTAEFFSGLDMITAGFGTRLYDKLSFGATVNIYSYESSSSQANDTLYENTIVRTFPADQFGTRFRQERVLDTSSYSGVNLTLGLRYDEETFSIGGVVRTPFSLEQETNRTVFITTLENGFEVIGENEQIHFDRLISKVDIPMYVGVGLAVRPKPNWTFALDGEYRPFSSSDIEIRDSLLIIPGEKDQEFFTTVDPQFENVFTVRAGGEFLWNTGSKYFPVVPLRAGYGLVPLPDSDIPVGTNEVGGVDEAIVEGADRVVSHNISVGAGVRWGQIHLDFAHTWVIADRDINLENQSFTYEGRDRRFSVQFTGFFD